MQTLPELAESIARHDFRIMATVGSVLDGDMLGLFNRRLGADFDAFYATRRDQYLEQAREIIAREAGQ